MIDYINNNVDEMRYYIVKIYFIEYLSKYYIELLVIYVYNVFIK